MCFATVVLISVPLMSAFPEAVEKNHNAGFFALIGFLFMFFSNKIIQYKTKQKSLASGITAVEGIAIHSFVDGIIYAVTFSSSILTGFLAGTGLVKENHNSGELKRKLLDMGMVLNAPIKVLKIAPLGSPIDILVKGYHLSLREDEAEKIMVEVE